MILNLLQLFTTPLGLILNKNLWIIVIYRRKRRSLLLIRVVPTIGVLCGARLWNYSSSVRIWVLVGILKIDRREVLILINDSYKISLLRVLTVGWLGLYNFGGLIRFISNMHGAVCATIFWVCLVRVVWWPIIQDYPRVVLLFRHRLNRLFLLSQISHRRWMIHQSLSTILFYDLLYASYLLTVRLRLRVLQVFLDHFSFIDDSVFGYLSSLPNRFNLVHQSFLSFI